MKNKIKIICVLWFVIGMHQLQAQQLLRHQFNGGFATNANGTFIIGESFNRTIETGSIIVAESILYQFANETLEIPPVDFHADIAIYPNPVESILNINSNLTSNLDITIFDTMGKVLLKTPYQTHLNLQSFPSGIYVLQVLDKEKQQIYNFKFIKK